MLEAISLTKTYPPRMGLSMPWRRPAPVVAVRAASLCVAPGEVLGIIGQSGSGKSTLGRMLVGLEKPSSGRIMIGGEDVADLLRRDRMAFYRRIQMVFQDPYGSINPQHGVFETVTRPLLYQRERDTKVLQARAKDALERVGLRPAARYLETHPHRLSGGQRQRLCIARAMILEPRYLVADEPISMLDVSIKWDIIRLLKRLVTEEGLALIYITHDLATVRSLCHRVMIMRAGEIVEEGPVDAVLDAPRHEYTRALIAACPSGVPEVAA
ncbi:MAG: ATP-binding cassette domain-containing protein [Proteobacteria bacterium]|nr:ATP-binding cassette domain-containing protein [Pseudomonadota bacterium]